MLLLKQSIRGSTFCLFVLSHLCYHDEKNISKLTHWSNRKWATLVQLNYRGQSRSAKSLPMDRWWTSPSYPKQVGLNLDQMEIWPKEILIVIWQWDLDTAWYIELLLQIAQRCIYSRFQKFNKDRHGMETIQFWKC